MSVLKISLNIAILKCVLHSEACSSQEIKNIPTYESVSGTHPLLVKVVTKLAQINGEILKVKHFVLFFQNNQH